MSQPLLQICNVTKQYQSSARTVQALQGVSLDIYPGEIVGLLGVNGAGKTTLSSIIASLHPPTSGDVLFHGKSIYNNIIAYRAKLGFCAQKQNLAAHMTVREHLKFAGRYFGMSQHAIKQRVDELMVMFSLTDYMDSNPAELSGGYRQRVLIARAIIHSPELVILDEPTVALDPHIRRHLWEIIRSLKAQGIAVVLTTHYLDEAEILSDRICLLSQGLVKLIETPQMLMSSYNKARLEDVFLQLINEETKK